MNENYYYITTAENIREMSKDVPGRYGLLPAMQIAEDLMTTGQFDQVMVRRFQRLPGGTIDGPVHTFLRQGVTVPCPDLLNPAYTTYC